MKSTTTTIAGHSYSVSTSYDNLGRVSSITYPNGLAIARNYNAYFYMTSITNVSTGGVIWQADSMDEFGHVTAESFGKECP